MTFVWCLSVAYIGPKWRTERPRKTKIGTEVAHVTVTRTPLSGSKDQRSRSPGRFTHRRVKALGSCSGQRGNVFTVGTYCYVAVGLAAWGASEPTERGQGRGILCRHAHSLLMQCSSLLSSVNFDSRFPTGCSWRSCDECYFDDFRKCIWIPNLA